MCKQENIVETLWFIHRVYEIEKRIKTPEKYLFPNYETCNWYAAKHMLDLFRGNLL